MPGKQLSVDNLPTSFLEALAEYQRNPIGVLRRNFSGTLPYIAGGAPDDDNGAGSGDGDGSGDGNPGADGSGGGDDGAGNGKQGPDDDSDGDGDEDEELPDNIKAILRKNRKAAREAQKAAEAADRRAREAEGKVKEYDDRDKSELQRAQDRVTELETENASLRDANKQTSLRSAFLGHTSVTWADPEDAFDLAMSKYGLKDLEVNEAGTVKDKKALGKLISDMAKDKSYLVKPKEGQGQDDAGKRQASGGSFNGGSGKNDGKSTDKLAQKYPAMRGRRRV